MLILISYKLVYIYCYGLMDLWNKDLSLKACKRQYSNSTFISFLNRNTLLVRKYYQSRVIFKKMCRTCKIL